MVTIGRSAYRGAIDETKTAASKSKLPVHPALAKLLLAWRVKCQQQQEKLNQGKKVELGSSRILRPECPTIPLRFSNVGYVLLARQSACKAWAFTRFAIHTALGSTPPALRLALRRTLMRHSAISTTFNVYGKALSPEKREANSKVVEMLLAQAQV